MGRKKPQDEWESEIRDLYDALHDYPDSTKLQSALSHTLKKWSNQMKLVFYCANNEQKPYTTDETGHQCLPMPTQQISGHRQTSDYICYLPEYNIITGIFWERKEVSDWYNTIIHNKERFYAECTRAEENQDSDILIVGVEGLEHQFLTFKPNGNIGATQQSRYALCESLAPRFNYSVAIRWHQNRITAIKDMIKQNRMWIKYNYKKILEMSD